MNKISNCLLLGAGALLMQSCGGGSDKKSVEQDKPNVLFIAVDDLNDWTGMSKGHPDVKTPNLDRLAQRGVYFTNAHTAVAVCTPSRLAVLSSLSPVTTGCYTNKSGILNQEIWNEVDLLPAYFRQKGYRTMACGKIEGHACWAIEDDFEHQKLWDERRPRVYGLTEKMLKDGNRYGAPDFYPFPMGGSGTTNYNKKHGTNFPGFSLCAGPIDREYLPEGKMPDEINVGWAIERLKKDYDKPFMLGVGFLRPHVPYTAPSEFFDMYPIDQIEVPKAMEKEFADIPMYGKAIAEGITEPGAEMIINIISPTYRKELVQGYLAAISFMDAQLGRLLDALDNSQYADNTIIVLWSDHGQCFGEKRNWRKNNLWNEATVSPMVWVVPGVTGKGQVSQQEVSLLDIYPTLTDLCGLDGQKQVDGESILPLLTDMKAKRKKAVISSWTHGSHSVRRDNWRYIRYYDGSEELYDEEKDFGEHHNLANDPKYMQVIAELKKELPKDIYQPTDKNEEFHMINNRVKRWSKNPESIPDYLN
ncbi:sulfatase [Marinifilum fragile]|uniref:sulfatase n=1 Tax=Marinifilum fragile TaxID=570161 RepID=UPI002AA86CB9|nr:sulfatase [Marinifilum fragile]